MVTHRGEYLVATCRRTRELLEWGWSRHGLWTPTSTVPATTGTGRHRVCAMPGYVFVPVRAWPVCIGTVPMFFNLRLLQRPEEARPYTVSLEELRLLQDTLAAATELASHGSTPSVAAYKYAPKSGDRVHLLCPPFQEMTGVVDKVRQHTVRVLVGTKYITVNKVFLRHELNE